ncbi:Ig-like domain-containing protein [Candidatus Micrarchaeota archaeon]|nr:Ig-like domain-containing protein [Candidatus Micrarchaeota archaeon]
MEKRKYFTFALLIIFGLLVFGNTIYAQNCVGENGFCDPNHPCCEGLECSAATGTCAKAAPKVNCQITTSIDSGLPEQKFTISGQGYLTGDTNEPINISSSDIQGNVCIEPLDIFPCSNEGTFTKEVKILPSAMGYCNINSKGLQSTCEASKQITILQQSVCGNAILEGGEECESNEDCGDATLKCENCQCVPIGPVPTAICQGQEIQSCFVTAAECDPYTAMAATGLAFYSAEGYQCIFDANGCTNGEQCIQPLPLPKNPCQGDQVQSCSFTAAECAELNAKFTSGEISGVYSTNGIQCDLISCSDGTACTLPQQAVCGNGVLEAGEECESQNDCFLNGLGPEYECVNCQCVLSTNPPLPTGNGSIEFKIIEACTNSLVFVNNNIKFSRVVNTNELLISQRDSGSYKKYVDLGQGEYVAEITQPGYMPTRLVKSLAPGQSLSEVIILTPINGCPPQQKICLENIACNYDTDCGSGRCVFENSDSSLPSPTIVIKSQTNINSYEDCKDPRLSILFEGNLPLEDIRYDTHGCLYYYQKDPTIYPVIAAKTQETLSFLQNNYPNEYLGYYTEGRKIGQCKCNNVCYDADGGNKPYMFGSVLQGGNRITDFCIDNALVEYYCEENNVAKKLWNCASMKDENGNSYICSGGACVLQQTCYPIGSTVSSSKSCEDAKSRCCAEQPINAECKSYYKPLTTSATQIYNSNIFTYTCEEKKTGCYVYNNQNNCEANNCLWLAAQPATEICSINYAALETAHKNCLQLSKDMCNSEDLCWFDSHKCVADKDKFYNICSQLSADNCKNELCKLTYQPSVGYCVERGIGFPASCMISSVLYDKCPLTGSPGYVNSEGCPTCAHDGFCDPDCPNGTDADCCNDISSCSESKICQPRIYGNVIGCNALPLASEVHVYNSKGRLVETFYTDNKGKFVFNSPVCGNMSLNIIPIDSEEYSPASITLSLLPKAEHNLEAIQLYLKNGDECPVCELTSRCSGVEELCVKSPTLPDCSMFKTEQQCKGGCIWNKVSNTCTFPSCDISNSVEECKGRPGCDWLQSGYSLSNGEEDCFIDDLCTQPYVSPICVDLDDPKTWGKNLIKDDEGVFHILNNTITLCPGEYLVESKNGLPAFVFGPASPDSELILDCSFASIIGHDGEGNRGDIGIMMPPLPTHKVSIKRCFIKNFSVGVVSGTSVPPDITIAQPNLISTQITNCDIGLAFLSARGGFGIAPDGNFYVIAPVGSNLGIDMEFANPPVGTNPIDDPAYASISLITIEGGKIEGDAFSVLGFGKNSILTAKKTSFSGLLNVPNTYLSLCTVEGKQISDTLDSNFGMFNIGDKKTPQIIGQDSKDKGVDGIMHDLSPDKTISGKSGVFENIIVTNIDKTQKIHTHDEDNSVTYTDFEFKEGRNSLQISEFTPGQDIPSSAVFIGDVAGVDSQYFKNAVPGPITIKNFIKACDNSLKIYRTPNLVKTYNEVMQGEECRICGNTEVPATDNCCQIISCNEREVTFIPPTYSTYGAGNPYAPMINNVSISPSSPNSDSTLICTASAFDLNNEKVTLEFNWYLNDIPVPAFESSVVCDADSECQSLTIPSTDITSGDLWTCSVRADDGEYYSDWESTSVSITPSPQRPGRDRGSSDGSTRTQEEQEQSFNVVLSSTCANQQITVTVSDGSARIAGALINFDNTLSQLSNANGQATFTLNSGQHSINVVKSGYTAYSAIITFADCTVPTTLCECATHHYCASDEYCDGCSCRMLVCPEGQIPINHVCTLPSECTQNTDCAEHEICDEDICVVLECACGTVKNHECIPYECCEDIDCLSNQFCYDFECYEVQSGETVEATKENIKYVLFAINELEWELNDYISKNRVNEETAEEIKNLLNQAKEKLKQGEYQEALSLINQAKVKLPPRSEDYLGVFVLLALILVLVFISTKISEARASPSPKEEKPIKQKISKPKTSKKVKPKPKRKPVQKKRKKK